MYRSVAVQARNRKGNKKDAPTEEATFLRTLHADLSRFGRNDATFVETGDVAILIWSTLYNQPAAADFRREVARARLAANESKLKAFETSHPKLFSGVFSIDTHKIVPEIVPCKDDQDLNGIFDYYLFQQSIESRVNRGRYGRFLVYDSSVGQRPILGIIGVSSPVYFNGGRDAELGWGPTGRRRGKVWVKDVAEQKKRDRGLLSLSHITVSTLVPPYSEKDLKLGRLLTSLCFSDEVIGFMESSYKRPITALTTTGGWGGSAGSYQRIRLRQTATGLAHLFVSLDTKRPSLNRTLKYFSDPVFNSALEVHRVSSHEPWARYSDFSRDENVKRELFSWTLHHLELPRIATYVNRISHYLGAVDDEGLDFLRKGARGRCPSKRTIPVQTSLKYWRNENKRERLSGVSPTPLTHGI